MSNMVTLLFQVYAHPSLNSKRRIKRQKMSESPTMLSTKLGTYLLPGSTTSRLCLTVFQITDITPFTPFGPILMYVVSGLKHINVVETNVSSDSNYYFDFSLVIDSFIIDLAKFQYVYFHWSRGLACERRYDHQQQN